MSYAASTATGAGSGTHSVFASEWVSSGDQPGQAVTPPAGQPSIGTFRRYTDTAEVKARWGGVFLGLIFETWLPFTASIVSRFIGPRGASAPWQSPYDVDGSERITRFGDFPVSSRNFPYPYEIGAVSGFMPMLDQYSLSWAFGKTPSGPGITTPIPVPWPASYPNLQKVTG